MAIPKGQASPVNLKERIAALQQRNVSPNTHQSAQAAPRGLPGAGTGRLRDKIAKFEEKGGVPVPRGSFAMGAPQLAENAQAKKHGELYGNRVPGLGRPSGPPIGRAGPSHPSTDELPGPRKRCISTGAALSSSPSSLSADEPVPPLPNGLSASAPRRNSLAVNFGSGRRVMSASDVDGKGVVSDDVLAPLLSSLLPEKPPETTDLQSSTPESPVEEVLLEVEESSLETPEVAVQPLESTLHPSESPPVVEQDPPAPADLPSPVDDAFENVSYSPTVEQVCNDGQSDYESAPQSAVSQPSQPLLEPTSSVPSPVSADPPSQTSITSAGTETVTESLPMLPLEVETKQVAASQGVPIVASSADPTAPVPSSIQTPDLTTEPRLQSKPTFKAVVHRKVSEPPVAPAPSRLTVHAVPQPIQQRRGISSNVIEGLPNPGFGDLAVLLEDAALLELRLTEGDSTSADAKELLEKTPTCATFQPDPRYSSASDVVEHAPAPSVDSSSQSARSVSVPSIREPLADGEIPEVDEIDGRSLASTTFSQRSPSHRKYLSNIYRLTSRRSSSYMPGSYPRDSMSMSSEDSSPITTPSDSGKRKGFAWPGTSPKNGGPNVSRSTSFADKLFNRNRTKSNVSTADQASERSSLYGASQPTLSLSFPSGLSSETRLGDVDAGARPTTWMSPGDSNSEFSPTSSPLDNDIFDAFPSVPQTLPPGFHLDAKKASIGRASMLSVQERQRVNQRL